MRCDRLTNDGNFFLGGGGGSVLLVPHRDVYLEALQDSWGGGSGGVGGIGFSLHIPVEPT